jgi:hypothetical protein
MSREIKRILINTMPRSGTNFLFDIVSNLFNFKKTTPLFRGGLPVPPEWDPYKFDDTYLSINEGEVLCSHYPLTSKLLPIIQSDDLLCIYLYRDPRDVAVSAALYIKNVLCHHPLHQFFQQITDFEAILFIITGGVISCDKDNYITHEGIKYFCTIANDWLNHQNVVAIRYEDLISKPLITLIMALEGVKMHVDETKIINVIDEFTFSKLSGGRNQGQENKLSHYRKGITGDYANYFSDTHKAICKLMIGEFLIKYGYESDFHW